MCTIKAKNYIEEGFSGEEAEILKTVIDKALETDETVTVDFSEMEYFITFFFNRVFMDRLDKMKVEEFNSRIFVENLSKVGQGAYDLWLT
ncbi:STAS-like domain-containing protein [Methanolapillus ohkumae]|uniref:DUF4325 domain-containing protein n=1 Tax=Methanolapillus ohkumae TaxID=3028298 RepID=A0AA96V540_9EURY|nr:hypothetical protein MsAm2_05330 [Methanosarcinaceae archaeon Am2]